MDGTTRDAVPQGFSRLFSLTPVEKSVLRTLAYADVFGFPLELPEIVHFCLAPAGLGDEIEAAVDTLVGRGTLGCRGRYYFLAGREYTVFTRRRLARSSREGWRVARRWGKVLWMLPYVRMVAVTGSLAADSKREEQDIDFMIVAAPGRLWLVRGLSLLVWRVARLFGVQLCPNYFLTTNALTLWQRDLYTARELVQMVPLHGPEVAARLGTLNDWTRAFLPNARLDSGLAVRGESRASQIFRRLAERVLAGSLADRLEAWERDRKVARLTAGAARTQESMFSADVCKDHSHAHGSRVRDLYKQRLLELGLTPEDTGGPQERNLACGR